MTLILLAALGCKDTTTDDTSAVGTDCSSLNAADIPPPVGELEGTWDPVGRRLVFFSGNRSIPEECSFAGSEFHAETWAFYPDCDAFEKLDDSSGPGGRGRFAAAADPETGKMYLHGGRYRSGDSGSYTLYNELWSYEFATNTWELVSSDGPSARLSHTMVLAGRKLVLYGGNSSTSGTAYSPLGDTWTWDLDGGGWTEMSTSNTPDARLFHGGATDGETLWVFSGGDANAFFGPFLNDLWALDLASGAWTEVDAGSSSGPEGRLSPDMFYDAAKNRLVAWSGHDDGELGNNNQMWQYDLGGGGWSFAREGDVFNIPAYGQCDFDPYFTQPDFESPERRYTGAADMTDDGHIVIFGGKTDCGAINDAWAYELATDTWTEHSKATGGEICLRVYDDCSGLCN